MHQLTALRRARYEAAHEQSDESSDAVLEEMLELINAIDGFQILLDTCRGAVAAHARLI
jgi:hypothetical protein